MECCVWIIIITDSSRSGRTESDPPPIDPDTHHIAAACPYESVQEPLGNWYHLSLHNLQEPWKKNTGSNQHSRVLLWIFTTLTPPEEVLPKWHPRALKKREKNARATPTCELSIDSGDDGMCQRQNGGLTIFYMDISLMKMEPFRLFSNSGLKKQVSAWLL